MFFCINQARAQETILKVKAVSIRGDVEQVTLKVSHQKAELVLNSNKWTKLPKVGWFETTAPNDLNFLKKKILAIKQDGFQKTRRKGYHTTEVSVDDKIINSASESHDLAIALLRVILISLGWQAEDELSIQGKHVVSSKSEKRFEMDNCRSLNKEHWLCSGEYGFFHMKEHPRINALKAYSAKKQK